MPYHAGVVSRKLGLHLDARRSEESIENFLAEDVETSQTVLPRLHQSYCGDSTNWPRPSTAGAFEEWIVQEAALTPAAFLR